MNELTITKFLSAFFTNEHETVNLITLAAKGSKGKPAYYKTSCAELSNNKSLQKQLIEDNKTKGVYFFVNSGGTRDADITKYNAFFIENDELPIEEQHFRLDWAPIDPSIRIETKKSVHAYWLIDEQCSEADWREIQLRLIAFFNSDKTIKNPARCLRLPHFQHVSYDGGNYSYKKIELADFNPTRRFTVEEMKSAFPLCKTFADVELKPELDTKQPQSSLNSYGVEEFIDRTVKKNKVVEQPQSSLNSLLLVKDPEKELGSKAAVPYNECPTKNKCFYGLAGDIVKTIEPHTETDSMALLLNTLVAFGNVIGRKAFFEADGSKHYTNLFSVLVGSTSSGKGTSWSQIRRLFKLVDDDWARNQIQSGLSSGEGLICAVKNNEEPKDKRLLIVESEFSSVLSMSKREGNTLSANIRGFWDNGTAQIMTKNDPVSANDAHISIIGHITPDELRHCLGRTEIANGFANRFLWLKVNRSKTLPEGGKVSNDELNALARKLSEAIEFAQAVEEIKRDEEARLLWRKEYARLTAERSGAFGSATSRSRPQVVRLSIIYALMDKSNIVRREHLEAALDFWNYCENSARQIFGESTGDKLADDIYQHLKTSEKGLTKTELMNKTGKNYPAYLLQKSLETLSNNGLVYSKYGIRDGSSRTVEVWYCYEFNEPRETSTRGIAQNDLGIAV